MLTLLPAAPARAETVCVDDTAGDAATDVTRFCIDATPERVRVEVTITGGSPVVFADIDNNEFGLELILVVTNSEAAILHVPSLDYVCLGGPAERNGSTYTWEMIAFGQRRECVTAPFSIDTIRNDAGKGEVVDFVPGAFTVDPQVGGGGGAGGPSQPGRLCDAGPVAAPAAVSVAEPDAVTRLAGPTRVETAVAVSRDLWSDGAAEVAAVVTADNFADAQTAT